MPRYVFYNPTAGLVLLPSPLSGTVQPKKKVIIDTQAAKVDTPEMKTLIKKGLLLVSPVTESKTISNRIEVPVMDLISGSLNWKGAWSPSVQYQPFDVVKYGSTSYVANIENQGLSPPSGVTWTSLASAGGSGSGGWDRIGISLSATLDPRLFLSPDPFSIDPEFQIEVFHSTGRKLRLASTHDPRDGDYVVEESGGAGVGVRFLTISPIGVVVNYKLV